MICGCQVTNGPILLEADIPGGLQMQISSLECNFTSNGILLTQVSPALVSLQTVGRPVDFIFSLFQLVVDPILCQASGSFVGMVVMQMGGGMFLSTTSLFSPVTLKVDIQKCVFFNNSITSNSATLGVTSG